MPPEPLRDDTYMTDREMIREIRAGMIQLTTRFDTLESSVIYKREFNLWQETRRTFVRWTVGLLISMGTLLVAVLGLIYSRL